MGNKQCGDFCTHADKNQIVHIQIIPASNVSQWTKEQQKTAITTPFKISVIPELNQISRVSNNQPYIKKELTWNDDSKSEVEDVGGLPPVEILKQQNHYIVPHSLVVSRVSEKTQLLMKKQFPTSPLMENDARWYLLNSGNYYNGELISEMPFGIGTYLMSNKVFYGETGKGKPEGMGVIISDEYIFKGEFANGKAEGDATIESQTYNAKGLFEEGRMKSGKVFTKQYVYEGTFLNNQPSGKGFYNNSVKKISYQGDFLNGKFHGKGTYTCPEYSYTGQFINGLKDGRGTIEHFGSGKTKTGMWTEDNLSKLV